jgi:hypothetical protein
MSWYNTPKGGVFVFEMFRWDRYGILYGLLGLVTLLCSAGGIWLWFTNYIATLTNTPNIVQTTSPIEVAGVTATLGGLILVGAFYRDKDGSMDNKQRKLNDTLKLAGKLLLVSSVCFIILYFLLEFVRTIDQTNSIGEWIFVISTDVAVFVGGFALSFALSTLVTIIRYI